MKKAGKSQLNKIRKYIQFLEQSST